MLLEELRSPWDLSITSHERDCRKKTANIKLIISEVMSFVCSNSFENCITREGPCETLRQITFFGVSRVPKRWSGIFNVSNAWANMWIKIMEENEGVERQNSKRGFEKKVHFSHQLSLHLVCTP